MSKKIDILRDDVYSHMRELLEHKMDTRREFKELQRRVDALELADKAATADLPMEMEHGGITYYLYSILETKDSFVGYYADVLDGPRSGVLRETMTKLKTGDRK